MIHYLRLNSPPLDPETKIHNEQMIYWQNAPTENRESKKQEKEVKWYIQGVALVEPDWGGVGGCWFLLYDNINT